MGIDLGFLKLCLLGLTFDLQLSMLLNLRHQRAELGIQFGLASERVTLRREVFQLGQLQTFGALAVPLQLGLLQLFGSALLFVLQLMQGLEPVVLKLELLELRLLSFQLLLGFVETLVEFGAGLWR